MTARELMYYPVYRLLRLVRTARKVTRPGSGDPSRVLVVELNSIGDAVITTYARWTLGRMYPGAEIDVLTTQACRELFDDMPGRGRCLGVCDLRRLRRRRYDFALCMSPAFRNLFFTYLSRAVSVAGFLEFYTGRSPYTRSHRATSSATERTEAWQIDESLLLGAAKVLSVLPGAPAAHEILRQMSERPKLPRGDKVRKRICLGVGSRTPNKQMPPGLILRIAEHLRITAHEYSICAIVTERERRRLARSHAVPTYVELCPAGTLAESIETIATSALFIGVDSAQLHLAQLTDVPVIGVFGPTRAGLALYRQSKTYAVEGRQPCDVLTVGKRARTECRSKRTCWPDALDSFASCVSQALSVSEQGLSKSA